MSKQMKINQTKIPFLGFGGFFLGGKLGNGALGCWFTGYIQC